MILPNRTEINTHYRMQTLGVRKNDNILLFIVFALEYRGIQMVYRGYATCKFATCTILHLKQFRFLYVFATREIATCMFSPPIRI